MRGKFTIIHVDGTREDTDLDKTPNLEFLQKAVGGHIETVPFFNQFEGHDCIAFCNEEGKLLGMPYNERATEFWAEALGFAQLCEVGDVLVGSIAIITGDVGFLRGL